MAFKAPKCPVCNRVQRASSALQHAHGNYACGCNAVDYPKATAHRREHPIQEEECVCLRDDETREFIILGEPVVKKNSMRVVSFGGHSSIRPSILYEVWASRAIFQLEKYMSLFPRAPIHGPVAMEVHFYRSTERKVDLSNLYEGIQDCMTTAGIWIDDTIVESHDGSRKHYDKRNPRIEVQLRKYHYA